MPYFGRVYAYIVQQNETTNMKISGAERTEGCCSAVAVFQFFRLLYYKRMCYNTRGGFRMLQDIEKDGVPLNDQELIEKIYNEHKRLMYSTAQKYVAYKPDQEDIVQTAVEKLMRQTSVLRTLKKTSLACYVVLAVKSVAVDFLREKAKQEEYVVELWDIEIEGIDTLDDLLITAEQLKRIKSVWPLLPKENQELLVKKYIAGYTDEELASQFKCKPSSIRMKLTRARRRAFDILSEKEEQ